MTESVQVSDMYKVWAELMGTLVKKWPVVPAESTVQNALFKELSTAYQQATEQMVKENPVVMIDRQMEFWKQQMSIFQGTMLKMAGGDAPPVVHPEKGDRRFDAPEWSAFPLFDYLRQSYLLLNQTVNEAIQDIPGMDLKTQQRLRFFTRQWLSAVSPGNFPLTNPEVLKLTAESGGENLVRGMRQLVEDMENSADSLNIRMTDRSAFRLGENIAATPGRVVFRNALMELIQYSPSTDTVHKQPLLIVPPWINKFYVLDLRPDNSFVRFARDMGHTVFMISWVNPGRDSRHWGIETYMQEGLLQALQEVQRITGESQTNVVGYCAGGILLAITLGWLAARNETAGIHTATHLATLFDFTDAGDIGVFIDDLIVRELEHELDRQGVLDGRMLAVTFSILRENDLYWNYYIQNYLKGERPIPFDMLYWNTDSTNVPAAVHKFFLRQLYIENRLRQPAGLHLLGRDIDLSQVHTPAFMVATRQDHIARWNGCYAGTQQYGGEVEFVLGESGHVAGILNPPGGRYGHFRHYELPGTAEQWFSEAQYFQESWWMAWNRWIQPFAGEQVPARIPVAGADAAPGQYVRVTASQALLSA